MVNEIDSQDWQERRIREWLLLLLRFAITCAPADHSAVLQMAEELDSSAWWRPGALCFFRRTSDEVCSAIRQADSPLNRIVLQRHVSRIDEPRLKRAFVAAVGLQETSGPARRYKSKKCNNTDLWKGLDR